MFAGSVSIVAGRRSMVAVRGSRFTVRGWRFAGRGSRSRRSDATLFSRRSALPLHHCGLSFLHRCGRPYAGVCVEQTTWFSLSRGVSRCRRAHPATVICITVVVLGGGGAFIALIICRGARTCVNFFPSTASSFVSYVRARSPFHDSGRLYAAGARLPHYIRAERPLWGRSGGVARLPCRQRRHALG